MARRGLHSLHIALSLLALARLSAAPAAPYRAVTLEYPPCDFAEGATVKGIAVDIVREEFALYSREPLVEQTIALFVLEDSRIVFDGDLEKLAGHSFGLANFSYGPIMDAFIGKA